jgi:hypothetical protein
MTHGIKLTNKQKTVKETNKQKYDICKKSN